MTTSTDGDFSRNSWQGRGLSHRLLVATEDFHHIKCPARERESQTVQWGGGGGGQGMGVKTPPSPGRGAGNRGGRRGREGEAPSPVQSLAQPVLRCVLVNSFLAEGRTEQPFLLLSPQPCCNGRQRKVPERKAKPIPDWTQVRNLHPAAGDLPCQLPASSPPASQPSPSPNSSPPLRTEEFKVGSSNTAKYR